MSIKELEEMVAPFLVGLSEEEKQHNRELSEMISAYEKKYPEGIPFQMPYKFEELKEALQQDKPFHKWEKYKGYYCNLPDYCYL